MGSLVLEDYIKFPLISEANDIYVWSKDREVRVLDWLLDCPDLSAGERERIIKKVNGETSEVFQEEFTISGPKICYSGKPIFRVRGWGYLTGQGGLGLSPETAVEIQDSFMKEFCRRANL